MKRWKIKTGKHSFAWFLLIILLIPFSDFFFFIVNKQNYVAVLSVVIIYSLFLLPIFLFRNRLRFYTWLLLPIILLVPFTLACIVFYNVPVNDSIVLLVVNSNQDEALELLRSYLLPFLLMISVCFIIYFVLLNKVPRQISFKQSAVISSCSLFVIITLPFYDGNQSSYFKRLRARFYTVYPTSLLYAAGTVYHQYQLMNSAVKQREAFTFHAKQYPAIHQKQVYVLVLGESVRYDHLGINGYYRNTTPKLSKEENIISFTNTNTSAFITEYSVPLIITGVRPDNFDEHYKQKSVVSAFKEAGFNTYWISNQVDNGHIKIHIEEADNKYLLMTDYKATKNIHNDSELLSVLEKVLNEPGEKKFIVLHHLGSHYNYASRYPDAYDYFKPSNKTVFSQANDYNSKKLIVNSYDNSLYYTDNILDSVITLVKSQNAVSSVYYISDHGENLFDDERHLSQHGYPVPSKYVAHIPFFIWYSNPLKQTMSAKIENLQLNRYKKSSAQNLFYTYTDMCGINFAGDDSAKSLCNRGFRETARQILGGGFVVYNSDSLK